MYLASFDSEADRTRMTEIYEDHKSVMLRYALSIVGSQEVAEDAVHNAFLAVIKNKQKYFQLPSRDLRALIVVITKNKCIDLLRQRKAFIDDYIDDMADVISADDIPVEDQVIMYAEYESIKTHIDSLDRISRLVLEMRYVLDMTYKEIGDELDMTSMHVGTRIMRAKEKVRKLVRKGGESGER